MMCTKDERPLYPLVIAVNIFAEENELAFGSCSLASTRIENLTLKQNKTFVHPSYTIHY